MSLLRENVFTANSLATWAAIVDGILVVCLLFVSIAKKTHGSDCTAKAPRCAKCSSPHPASSKSCGRYLFEKEVVSFKILKKLTLAEARSRVLSLSVRLGITFASVINKHTSRLSSIQLSNISCRSPPFTRRPVITLRGNYEVKVILLYSVLLPGSQPLWWYPPFRQHTLVRWYPLL